MFIIPSVAELKIVTTFVVPQPSSFHDNTAQRMTSCPIEFYHKNFPVNTNCDALLFIDMSDAFLTDNSCNDILEAPIYNIFFYSPEKVIMLTWKYENKLQRNNDYKMLITNGQL